MLLKPYFFFFLLLAPLSISAFDLVAQEIAVEEDVKLPDPSSLSPGWWEFFHVDSEETFLKRKEQLVSSLGSLQSSLDQEQKDKTAPLIRKLIVNLDALPKVKSQAPEQTPEKPFFDSYTIDQQLDVADRTRALAFKLKAENRELLLTRANIRKIESHLDDLMVTYLKMEKNSFQRLLTGLEIMSLRSAVAVTDEKLDLIEQRVDLLRGELKRSKEEEKWANSHLNLSTLNEEELIKSVEEAKKSYEAAKSGALKADLSAAGSWGDTPLDRSTGSLMQLKASDANTLLYLKESEVLFAELKLLMAREVNSEEGLSEKEKELLQEISTRLAALSDASSEAQNKADEELERTALLSKERGEESEELARLHQESYKVAQSTLKNVEALKAKLYGANVLTDEIIARERGRTSKFSSLILDFTSWLTGCCTTAFDWLHRSLFRIGDVPVTLYDLILALIIFGFAYVVSFLVRHFVARVAKRHGILSQSSVFILNRIAHYIILLLGLMLALSAIGLDLNRIFLLLGALSVGIGFGLQTIVNNFVSSLILIFTRAIKVGDVIQLSTGEWGGVSAINVQNTIIRTVDGIEVIVPNSTLVSNRFDNWTLKDPYKRLHINFSAPYGVSKEAVVEAALKAAKKVPATISGHPTLDDPAVWIANFGPSSIEYELVVWVNIYTPGHRGSPPSSYRWEIENALREAGIEMPYPQMDVRLQQSPK